MQDLTDALTEAAGPSTAPFTAADIHALVAGRRTARRRRSRVALVGAVLATFAIGVGVRHGADEAATDEVSTRPPYSGHAFKVHVPGHWNASRPGTALAVHHHAWVEFRSDGTLVGHDGCYPFHATWSVEGTTLVVGGLGPTPPLCKANGDEEFRQLLRGHPEVELGRRDVWDSMRLVAADGSSLSLVRFPRTDRFNDPQGVAALP